jgi:SAM-dependent methyltransferase
VKAPHTDRRTFCRACYSGHLHEMLDLGSQPPSNAFLRTQEAPEKYYPLRAVVCGTCFLMQLDYDVSARDIFDDYVYFSSGSKQWLDHTRRYCDMIYKRLELGPTSNVIEIGSNDGSLLENLKGRCHVLGIDPSSTVAAVAIARGVPTMIEHLTEMTTADNYADLVIANNVLAHIPDLAGAVKAIARLLKPTGTATIEFPHVVELLDSNQFDTIYHEHYSYLSLTALEPLLNRCKLHVYDVERLPTHGGSLRLYVSKQPRPASKAVFTLHAEESWLTRLDNYKAFAFRAKHVKEKFNRFLHDHAQVYAYGAAAKGNTFLNYCGATSDSIRMVGDVTSAKQGKFLPGSRIPVVSEEVLLMQRPPYTLILPWNWRDEIVRKLAPQVKHWGGKLVVAVPELTLI